MGLVRRGMTEGAEGRDTAQEENPTDGRGEILEKEL